MKKVVSILRRVAASVWMPPVALIGIVLANFIEDALWFKYPVGPRLNRPVRVDLCVQGLVFC